MKAIIFTFIVFGALNAFALDKKADSLEVPVNAIELETRDLLKGIGANPDQIAQFIALESKYDEQVYFSDSELDAIENAQLAILGEDKFASYQVAEAIEFERILASQ